MKPTKCSKCGATMKSSDPRAVDEFKALHKDLHATTAKATKATKAETTTKKEEANDGDADGTSEPTE